MHDIADLQSKINEAFSSNSCLYSIFFDLQEAYPRVWPYLICKKLHEAGLRGNLPKTLEDFLHNRTISVRIQDKFPPLILWKLVSPREKYSVYFSPY